MRANKLYYLTVEGETEKWYFEHLQKLINQDESIPFTVKFNIKVGQSVHKSVKSIAAPFKVKAFHICDYESNDAIHIKKFKDILEHINTSKTINKNVLYELGYSNFSFELWIIIHKFKNPSLVVHRKDYIKDINKAYGEEFQFIDDYKKEKNFKRKILSKIKLEDVITAVENGEGIRKRHEDNNDKFNIYGRFKYYQEAPDITIHNCIKQILRECEVFK